MTIREFPHDISVVIVAHNALNDLPQVLGALDQANCPVSQITVVDVASTDGGPEWVEQAWKGVQVIRLTANEGPNPARNIGIRTSSTPYVFLMDSDIVVETDTVPMLKTVIDQDSAIAIVSPIIVYANQPDTIQYGGTGLHFLCEAVNRWQGRSLNERGYEIQDIGVAPGGALLLLRSAAINVDLFDESYFMGKEDGDFAHRIKLAGYRVLEVPQAKVLHHDKPRQAKLYYYQIRNRWRFMLKNYQLRTLACLLPILLSHEIFQIILLTCKGHGATYLKAALGLIKMMPSLASERSKVDKYRILSDEEILEAGPLVVPEDFIKNVFLRKGKGVYDQLLQAYWFIVTKSVLKQ